MLDLITFCKKIEPFVLYYKRLITSYNNTAHDILRQGDKLDVAPDSNETKMWNYHHTGIKFHRVSL